MTESEEAALYATVVDVNAAHLISLLDAGADANRPWSTGGTPLISASLWGRGESVRVLLERGAEVNAIDDSDASALTWATRYGLQMEEPNGGITVVRLLLKYGADANHRDSGDETPLMLAAQEGCADAIRLLLDHGADVDAMEENGCTPLIAAASSGGTEAAKVLLQAGANVNVRGRQGWTPLHFAVHNSNVDCVRLFLSAGANVNIQDDNGSVLALARERNNPEIIGLLTDGEHSRD